MRGRNQNEKNEVRGKEVFVGIDVHKESWQVTIRTEGEEVFHGRIASDYRILLVPHGIIMLTPFPAETRGQGSLGIQEDREFFGQRLRLFVKIHSFSFSFRYASRFSWVAVIMGISKEAAMVFNLDIIAVFTQTRQLPSFKMTLSIISILVVLHFPLDLGNRENIPIFFFCRGLEFF